MREEEVLQIPVTPYFRDLDKKHIMAKSEVAFISFMVEPLWKLFDEFFGGVMSVATKNIEVNLREWNAILEKALRDLENQNQLHVEVEKNNIHAIEDDKIEETENEDKEEKEEVENIQDQESEQEKEQVPKSDL